MLDHTTAPCFDSASTTTFSRGVSKVLASAHSASVLTTAIIGADSEWKLVNSLWIRAVHMAVLWCSHQRDPPRVQVELLDKDAPPPGRTWRK